VKSKNKSKNKTKNKTKSKKNLDSEVGSTAEIESCLYMLKDILRGAVTTDTPAQTEKVFNLLTSLHFAQVVEVKNGFQDKDGVPFDPAN